MQLMKFILLHCNIDMRSPHVFLFVAHAAQWARFSYDEKKLKAETSVSILFMFTLPCPCSDRVMKGSSHVNLKPPGSDTLCFLWCFTFCEICVLILTQF